MLDGYAAGSSQSPATLGLSYLSLRYNDWSHTAHRLRALAWSLPSLELLTSPGHFDPALLIDDRTGQPLLPRLQHLRIDNISSPLSLAGADSYLDGYCRLLRAYSHLLRCLSLVTMGASSCWPLLEAVFACSALRRCELSFVFQLWREWHSTSHRIGARPAPPPDANPPPLRSLPHLHTLAMRLPLSEAQLRRVLLAAPALHHLSTEARADCYSDALHAVRLIAQRASAELRSLVVLPDPNNWPDEDEPKTAPEAPAVSQPTSSAAPSSPPPLPALQAFEYDGSFFDRPQLLRSLVELLQHAPLHRLHLGLSELRFLHHLAPLKSSSRWCRRAESVASSKTTRSGTATSVCRARTPLLCLAAERRS